MDDLSEFLLRDGYGHGLVEAERGDGLVGGHRGDHHDRTGASAPANGFEDFVPGPVGQPSVEQHDVDGLVQSIEPRDATVGGQHPAGVGQVPLEALEERFVAINDHHRRVRQVHRIRQQANGRKCHMAGIDRASVVRPPPVRTGRPGR